MELLSNANLMIVGRQPFRGDLVRPLQRERRRLSDYNATKALFLVFYFFFVFIFVFAFVFVFAMRRRFSAKIYLRLPTSESERGEMVKRPVLWGIGMPSYGRDAAVGKYQRRDGDGKKSDQHRRRRPAHVLRKAAAEAVPSPGAIIAEVSGCSCI